MQKAVSAAEHLGIVHRIARQLRRHPYIVAASLSLDDLLSAGSLALVRAADAFEPERGLCFTTFAFPRVRGAMLDEARAVLGHRHTRRESREVAQVRARLTASLGREPLAREMAAALNVPLEEYEARRLEASSMVVVSLDAPAADESDESLLDRLAATPADPLLAVSLEDLLRRLPSRERDIVTRIYVGGKKAREVAADLGVTESRISQLHLGALRKLRAWWMEESTAPAALVPFRRVSAPPTMRLVALSRHACPRCGGQMAKHNGRGRRPKCCARCRTPAEQRHVLYMRQFNERRRIEKQQLTRSA